MSDPYRIPGEISTQLVLTHCWTHEDGYLGVEWTDGEDEVRIVDASDDSDDPWNWHGTREEVKSLIRVLEKAVGLR